MGIRKKLVMKKIILTFLCIFFVGEFSLFSWSENEDFTIIKSFGFNQTGQMRSPATILKVKENFNPQDFFRSGDLLFEKKESLSSFSSFPQEDDLSIFFFDNFLRKELYISNDSFNNFFDFQVKRDDLVSFYLYDSREKRWINPFFIKPLLGPLSIQVKGFFVEFNGKKFPLQGRTFSLREKDDFAIVIEAESLFLDSKGKSHVGLYGLTLRVNGVEWLDFKTQAIFSEENSFKWVDLNTEESSFEEGVLRIFSPLLKSGLNEIEVEVWSFLYGSLKIKGYIRVLPPLVK